MSVSTHVLDGITGRPAAGVSVLLERAVGLAWEQVRTESTDADGRIGSLGEVSAGVHRITFDTGAYYGALGIETFYPQVTVVFDVTDPGRHHHVPLLLSPFAYSTYRGS